MHRIIGADLYSPSRYNAFAIFRDGAKTSLLRVFTAQRISYAISRTIMYVSVSQQHAAMSVRWMRRQIMYNQKFAATFSLKKGEKWTDEHCEIYHGIEETPITLLAMGITGQIRGFNPDDYRPDLIIMDDVLNEENTATEEQRKKIDALIFGALLNSLAPETDCPTAKAVFLQTPLNRNDALEKCLKDPQWHGRRFGCFDEKGISRWESRWPTETLLREKQAAIARGQYALWMREKECAIVAHVGKTFEIERLKYWDTIPLPPMIKFIAIDPASADSPKADDTAIAVVGFNGEDVYVLAYYAEVGAMPDAVAAMFFAYLLEHSIMRLCVETVAYQRILAWYLEREMQTRRQYVTIDKVQDRRKKSDRIIQAMVGLVNFGHLYVHSSMTKLIMQMDEYDPNDDSFHDDILDAVSMAIVSMNPALRSALTIEGEFTEVIDDERAYKKLAFGGCP